MLLILWVELRAPHQNLFLDRVESLHSQQRLFRGLDKLLGYSA